MRSVLFYISCILSFSCYFNPLVNSIVSPEKPEENNSFLGLLGLSGPTLLITGQIIDANGLGEAGLVLQPGKSFAPQSKSTSSGYTTVAGGRFYIPYQSGQVSFTVYKENLYYFEFTLDIASTSQITYSLYGAAPGIQINGLGAINIADQTNVFDLVRAYTIDGQSNQVPLNANVNVYISAMIFEFSEAPIHALANEFVNAWISENISVSPATSFDNVMNVSGNTLTISPMGLGGMTAYEITLGSGILSATGKPLTPRTIQFFYQFNP
ncbi:Ig-like domain-containing protein [Leptospira sp. 2 VSF19]|uniref:Ig-like domain-containing protein n=1 Tax=Leptospira soteropolitanensis TaxID=2950025 RepID=A0AAW5VE27_9LEPT|nr:Ig-like domain-containing protein [Leptospira soteropolitanensis]MCW7491091.1 Ig-like domain-containing protein [Leptospira soteropolitanensis]MCW7498675.1 Ig-like domain-containing protein [Leptospira soteropolitanensis]MCW7521732.1 Ig-like domain-containing protein [Leptospira soteropolitanensis]MCW7524779.1 Ig-like domain-containing protein [Leptospira soteropolitanensis]MCW7528646.1 Ig-like domain-containing protein [Leptospira soteropolitanensis]